MGFRRQDISTPKTSTSKGTFEEPANQWQKFLKKCYDTTHKIAKLNANPPYFHVIICLPDENIQFGRVVAVLNQGKMGERSKALGLDPSIFGCVGSNPTLVN